MESDDMKRENLFFWICAVSVYLVNLDQEVEKA